MNVSRLKRPILGVLAAFAAALVLMMMIGGSARAAEHQFCWGANIPTGNSCGSASWSMSAAYTNSSDGPVCLSAVELAACMKSANEGLYLNRGECISGAAHILNWVTTGQKKVYGLFWTC